MTAKLESHAITLAWYNQHYQSLYTLVKSQVKCQFLTQDILQDLYFKLEKIPNIEAINNPKNYLMQIACRLVVDTKRLKTSQIITEPDTELAEVACPQSKPEAQAINQNLINNIQIALDKLPKEKRDIIWLSAIEGWSHSRIALHKGRSLSWVEKSIAQGMVLLTEFKRQSLQGSDQ